MRIADPPPVVCSSCFTQQPQVPHVDFETAWDGPTIDGGVATGDGVQNRIVVTIDDLNICQRCLTAAGALVGLEPVGESVEKIEALEARVGEMGERLAGQADYIGKLEAAAASREALGDTLKPKPQKPRQRKPVPA